MFCPDCGAQVGRTMKFCPSCGNRIKKVTKFEIVDTHKINEPILIIRPRFIGILTFLTALPLGLFFGIWGAGFFGGFSLAILDAAGMDVPCLFVFVFFGLFFFFIVPFIYFIIKKKTYNKTEYRFYPDKLEYYEGFFTVQQKSIKYRAITEVFLRKGVLQNIYGLGTIVLSTPATSRSSGIRLYDIPDPDNAYKEVKDLIDNARF